MKSRTLRQDEIGLMSDIISTIKSHINHLDGMERLAAQLANKHTPELDRELEKWKLYCDVLRLRAYEEDAYNDLKYNDNQWKTIDDVSDEFYQEVIESTIKHLREHLNWQTTSAKSETKVQLAFLSRMLNERYFLKMKNELQK